MFPNCIEKLISSLKKIPGVGNKTAERMGYSILDFDRDKLTELIVSLNNVKDLIHKCPICNNYTDNEICSICSDENRDNSKLIIIEKAKDIIPFEKIQSFNGKYHVLENLISPMDGIGPEQLNIDKLVQRIQNFNIQEIIIIFKPSIEGETTAQYIKKICEKLQVKISKIPIGIPLGIDLEYVDLMTLEMALDSRKDIA